MVAIVKTNRLAVIAANDISGGVGELVGDIEKMLHLLARRS